MNGINPGDLMVFLAIARHRSFRKASEELGLQPSALSHSLKMLEERLAVRLFNRTTRSVSLTEAGKRLHQRVEPAFREIDSALDELNHFRTEVKGNLRFNVGQTAAQLVLLPLVTKFLQLHPAVNVELALQNAMVDIVEEGFDAGVRFGDAVSVDMIAFPIGPEVRATVVGTPAFFSRWSVPCMPEDLLKIPCIRWKFDTGADSRWAFEKQGEKKSLRVEGPLAIGSQQLMVQAALDNLGAAYVFEGTVREPVEDGKLLSVLEDWCPVFPRYHFYFPGRRQIPAALQAFIDFIRAENAKNP